MSDVAWCHYCQKRPCQCGPKERPVADPDRYDAMAEKIMNEPWDGISGIRSGIAAALRAAVAEATAPLQAEIERLKTELTAIRRAAIAWGCGCLMSRTTFCEDCTRRLVEMVPKDFEAAPVLSTQEAAK